MLRVFAVYNYDMEKWYAGSDKGRPVWSDVPKTFSSRNHMRLSLQVVEPYLTGRLLIQECELKVVDSSYVSASDVLKKSNWWWT